jgi:hypothetical protein
MGREGQVRRRAEEVVVEPGGEVLRGHGLATRYRDCLSGSKGLGVNTTLLYTYLPNWELARVRGPADSQ